jgi:hypothetical protein
MLIVRRGALLLALILLFLVANRAAYEGWFMDDDLDNLAWTVHHTLPEFGAGVVSPKFAEFNYRPVGHVIYHWLGARVGLEYGWYVGVMHVLHLVNVLLVWVLLRRLGAGERGAGVGALLFAFHMACFDAYWKPMFVFDVVATLFYLLALLAYLSPRWWLALIPFWLSYKGKELAVTLPAVLLLYEYTLGERRWRRVIPFAAVAASFTLQGVLRNAGTDNAYTLRFTPAAVWTTLGFYSSKILLLPWAGLLLIPAGWLSKDARVRFGLLAIPVLLGPLWFLPGRLFGVYLYLPLVGLAVAAAFASERWRWWVVAALFAVWLPWNYQLLREGRKSALTVGPENRTYVEQVGEFAAKNPELRTILFDGGPTEMNQWGVVGALRWYYRHPDLRTAAVNSEEAKEMLEAGRIAVLGWDRARRRLIAAVRDEEQPDVGYIEMTEGLRVWQFGEGWFPLEGGFRWMAPRAWARLRRPAGVEEFEVRVNLGPQQYRDRGRVGLELWIDGESQGVREYDRPGWSSQRWAVKGTGEAKVVEVELRAVEAYRPTNGDPRVFGAAITGFGFVSR